MIPSLKTSKLEKATPMLLDVIIIGGGLSGMMVAYELHHAPLKPPLSWNLFEAQPELGGRLKNDAKTDEIDLGGAWIWPTHQPFMKKLKSKLSIPTFPQPDDSSSTRIVGGAVQFVHELAKPLPEDSIKLNSPVTACTLDDSFSQDGPVVRVDTKSGSSFHARRVVFAVPPKILSEKVKFHPPLSREKQAAMRNSQTWMAGVTKVSLVYSKRFWRLDSSNMGLPRGNGPAFQVYDASNKDASLAALTFFSMVPPNSPALHNDELLVEQCATQIQSIWSYFGLSEQAKKAKTYYDYHIQRWPNEEYISDDARPSTVTPHPHPVMSLSTKEWNGALLFAGSETDRGSPGVMEGAVGAAIRVVEDLKAYFKNAPARGAAACGVSDHDA